MSQSLEMEVEKTEEYYEDAELREFGISTFYSMQECMRENGIEKSNLEIKIENMIIENRSPILRNVVTLMFDQAKEGAEEAQARFNISQQKRI